MWYNLGRCGYSLSMGPDEKDSRKNFIPTILLGFDLNDQTSKSQMIIFCPAITSILHACMEDGVVMY